MLIDVLRDMMKTGDPVRVIMVTGFQYANCSIDSCGVDHVVIREGSRKHYIALAAISTIVK